MAMYDDRAYVGTIGIATRLYVLRSFCRIERHSAHYRYGAFIHDAVAT